jgi:NodT family efflux transporter outer membrane factor (OMF) lipoprotein
MTIKLRFAHISVAGALACALSACMVGPKYRTPPGLTETPPQAYKEVSTQPSDAGEWKVADPRDAMLRGNWWEIFKDPQLNDLEHQLNINNQDIRQFFQNFMEARALIGEANSQLYPTVSVGPSYSYSLTPSSSAQSFTAGARNFWSVPFDASWEIDLWGKLRNQVNSAAYTSQTSAGDLANEQLSEQASLAVYFFEIRGQDALIKLFNDTIDFDKKQVQYTQSQYQTGVGDQISVVEAQNTLASNEASATNLEIARAQYEHAIAVLIGKNPSQFSIPAKTLVAAPPPIPIGLPSQLLERRPDIAAAERTMAAANAQIGIAETAYYPELTLSGSAGFENEYLGALFNWPSRFFSVGPSVSYTIFDAGLRQATVNQYIATYNADLAAYRQTVLVAFQQVEDNLAGLRILSRQMVQENQAVQLASNYLNLEMGRYQTGIDPYLDVVIAQTTLLSNQQALLNVQIEEMTSAVQLITSLGGGWDSTQLPTTRQVEQWPTTQETAIQK